MSEDNKAPERAPESKLEISAKSQRWLKAGIALGNDPKALVLCPACGKANLEVIDAHAGGRLDRYIHCPSCNKYNVLTNVVSQKPPTKEP